MLLHKRAQRRVRIWIVSSANAFALPCEHITFATGLARQGWQSRNWARSLSTVWRPLVTSSGNIPATGFGVVRKNAGGALFDTPFNMVRRFGHVVSALSEYVFAGAAFMQWRTTLIDYDVRGHERSCPDYDRRALFVDPESTHVDLFCDCHHFTEPMVLENGTDIAWPAGWDDTKAAEWRRTYRMERPAEKN